MARFAVAGIFAFGFAVLAGAGWARLHGTTNPSSAAPNSSEPSSVHPTATATTAPAVFATPAPVSPSPVSPSTAPPSTPSATAAWRGIVGYLEATRVEAFATARPDLLSTVYTPNAPGLAVDTASVRALAGRGLRAAGFTATVERVTVTSSNAERVSLRVVDRLSSYRLVNASGTTVTSGAARPARAFTMNLTRTPNGWRIAAIVP